MENSTDTQHRQHQDFLARSTRPAQILRRESRQQIHAPRLLACVDRSDYAGLVAQHAMAIACSLGLEVTLARVVESRRHFASPADPVEWLARQRSQQEDLRTLANQPVIDNSASPNVASVLLAGAPADELTDWSLDHRVTLLALGRHDKQTATGLGSTAKKLLERGDRSLLIVPPSPANTVSYARIMVPIDGSARAESVLPLARRIARTHGATLLLVHVLPQLDLMDEARHPQIGRLHSQIDTHNEQNVRNHLEDLRTRSVEDGVPVRAITAGPGDARTELQEIANQQNADLIVMSSHGCSGREDVPCGSVTEYMAAYASSPVLIVRPNIECSFGPEPANCRNASAFRFF